MDNYIGYTIYSQIRDENLSLFLKYLIFLKRQTLPKREMGVDFGEGTEEAYFRLPNRREPKDLFPLNVTLKPVKMGV